VLEGERTEDLVLETMAEHVKASSCSSEYLDKIRY